MESLTNQQNLILDQIKIFIYKNGYSPSIRELCEITGKSSPATIHYHLKRLKKNGYIDYIEGRNRTIRVIEEKK